MPVVYNFYGVSLLVIGSRTVADVHFFPDFFPFFLQQLVINPGSSQSRQLPLHPTNQNLVPLP